MEYAPDGSLGDLVNKGQQIPFDTVLDYFLQAADALSYAHGKDITHGNMKLSNLLLGSKGILLSDFEMLTRRARGLVDTSPFGILTQGTALSKLLVYVARAEESII
jgi:serine/threonine protein kinase